MPDVFFPRRLIGLLWLLWGLYWLVAAASSKRTVRRESAGARLAYVIPLLIGALLIGWRGVPWAPLAARLWPSSLTAWWIGLVLVATGMGFSVWARVHLGTNWSGSVTVKEGHELIRSGPYAYVRHPIYTGLIASLLGTAIAVGTAGAALGFAIISASFVRKLRAEEVFMRETFPVEYPRYRAEVPGLVPFTRPRRSAPR
jgi:protein-S-isoprenylcysteine O-methyltransferase Ste14